MKSLREQIANLQQQNRSRMPAEVLNTLMADTQRMVQSAVAEQALGVGTHAPAFALPNAVGKTISSDALLHRGPLVISFYRGAWCPYCNLELRALQEALPRIHELGAELVAISPNLPDKSLTSIEKHALTYEVLTDVQNRIARRYGLVITLGEKIQPLYKQIGFDIPGHNGDDSWELPMPATYVVAPDGEIAFSFVTADYTRRAEPADIIAALEAIQVKTPGV